MHTLLYIFSSTISLLLSILELLMLGRAILSWFPLDEDNPLVQFLYWITEPVIYPMRVLLDKFDLFQGLPIDMAFFCTFILINILSILI